MTPSKRSLAPTLLLAVATTPSAWAAAPLSADEARQVAIDAYMYAYPLVLIDVTRRKGSNVVTPRGLDAPINQLAHATEFPDATFTSVVRPNADTLYSSLWFDVQREPLVVHLPDSGGRYYLLEMMDAWSDVFDSPGKRTTGTAELTFALRGPGWSGTLPSGMLEIKSPTARGWFIGRTQTNGKADYPAVRKFQAGMTATPLSKYGQPYAPPKGTVNPKVDNSPPVDQVEKLPAAEFFARFADMTAVDPPHANDYPIVHQLARLGIVPGKPFDLNRAAPETKAALEQAPAAALKKIKSAFLKSGIASNGWRTNLTAIGTYGADYAHRAGVAYAGLGANTIKDAVYPSALADGEGKPFDSAARYVLHFTKDRIPPVLGFWSLTMYNQRQFFADNPINRYAIGDRDKLKFNADGSLDLFIQRESPGGAKESNWLPAPKSGGFTMNLRLYWPKPEVLDGTWSPPPVERDGD